EIIDIAMLINKMGAKIKGVCTSTIRIEGVDEMHGASHQQIPDRIEAGTYIAAAAAVGQGVTVNNVIAEHIESFLAKLREMGVKMDISDDAIYIHPNDGQLKAVDIKTAPYPGFATDLQQPITPLLLTANGNGKLVDTIYPKRVKHVPELARMGANIEEHNDQITYNGPNRLTGVTVTASDLRAGAGLVIAALMAEGETELYGRSEEHTSELHSRF